MISCKCGHHNPDGSLFCEECGNKLSVQCPACHKDLAPGSKFCQFCGNKLASDNIELGGLAGGSVVAGDVHTTIINNHNDQPSSSSSIRCHTCGKELPQSAKFNLKCSVCGLYFCNEHIDVSNHMCPSCTEKMLSAFEYRRYDNGKYAITGVKNKDNPSIVIPNCVETIEAGAFIGCTALTVTLPNGLLRIGDRAFADCECLVTIRFPFSLKYIGAEAFRNCRSLNLFSAPHGVTLGENAFIGTPLASRQEKLRRSLDISKIGSSTRTKNDNPSVNNNAKKSESIEKANDDRQAASSKSFKDQIDDFKSNMVQKSPLLKKISDYKWAHIKGWYLSWMIVWIVVMFLGFGFFSLIGLIGAICMCVKYCRVRTAEKDLRQDVSADEAAEMPDEPQEFDGEKTSESSDENSGEA